MKNQQDITQLRDLCAQLQEKLNTVTELLEEKTETSESNGSVTDYEVKIRGGGVYLKHMLDPFKSRICELFTKMIPLRESGRMTSKLRYGHRVSIEGNVFASGDDISEGIECDLRVQLSDGWDWAYFNLAILPGCCKVVVSHKTHVPKRWQRQGWASLMQEMKVVIAKYIGATTLVATVQTDNDAENQCLLKHGWNNITLLDSGKLGFWTKTV